MNKLIKYLVLLYGIILFGSVSLLGESQVREEGRVTRDLAYMWNWVGYLEEVSSSATSDQSKKDIINKLLLDIRSNNSAVAYEYVISLIQQSGSSVGYFILGIFYNVGFQVTRNLAQSFQMMKISAEANDIDAEYMLGMYYLNGTGTDRNESKAVFYLRKSSLGGNSNATKALQNLLVSNIRVSQDYLTSCALGTKEEVQSILRNSNDPTTLASDATSRQNVLDEIVPNCILSPTIKN